MTSDESDRVESSRVNDGVLDYLEQLTAGAPPGTRLPSERVLAEKLGVARNTVRAGIQHLMTAGRLTSKVGSGLYVSTPKDIILSGGPRSLPARSTGRQSFDRASLPPGEISAGHELAGTLAVALSEPLVEFRRLLSCNGDTVAIESVVIPRSRVPRARAFDPFRFFGSPIPPRSSTFSCELSTTNCSHWLGIPVGRPLLVVEHLRTMKPDNIPVIIRWSYRADRVKLAEVYARMPPSPQSTR
ncbi:GntR family transcriptional regulator [Amycolatopsis thailandensis]|uniref:GntR family transcriptional regulator n=1 Tax=Amycolatopsis thailandensis TaxID=589330 RepID=UPI00362D533D